MKKKKKMDKKPGILLKLVLNANFYLIQMSQRKQINKKKNHKIVIKQQVFMQ